MLAVASLALAQSQATTNPKPETSKTGASAAAKKGTATGKKAAAGHGATAGAKTAARARTTRGKGKKTRAKAAPTYQLHPDPERYQQIQQALADRGYFKGQVNGDWGDDSVEALKKFQADQKMDTDGKINALSLIGLGLGPKHDGTSAVATPVPPPPPPTTEVPPPTADTPAPTAPN